MSDKKSLAVAYGVQRRNKAIKPRRIPDELDSLDEPKPTSIAESILYKKRQLKIRDNDEGIIDLEENDAEGPASLDKWNAEVAKKTGEKAPEFDGRAKGSIAEKIRSKRKGARV